MPCLPNATLSNDGNVQAITLWVRKMTSSMISAQNYVFVQNNLKISSGQNVHNFLFYGTPTVNNMPKLGLKNQLKVQNIDLSITITYTNTESSWLNVCQQ